MVDQKMIEKNYMSMLIGLPADMLEEVVTNLPTIDLLSASCVSNDWLHAVRYSLRRSPRLFPWLVLRRLPHPTSSSYSIHALDPYSRTWLSVTCRNPTDKQLPTIPHFLCGSTRDRLYALSLSKMVISRDPFGNTRQIETKGPKVWRQDPVVTEVGRWIVVVGGGILMDLDEGEEEGAVEVYDKQTGRWEMAQPMPVQFHGSTYRRWLSVAVSNKRLCVIEKRTGWISQFDPESKRWGPTRQVRPDQLSISAWAIAAAGAERLLLIGAGREGEGRKAVIKVRAWAMEGDTLRVVDNKSEEIPAEMVRHLFPNFDRLSEARQQACSIEVCGTERGGYIFDPANMKNGVVMYQLSVDQKDERIVERWEPVPCPPTVGDDPMEGISVGCSAVTLSEVARCFV